MTVKEFSHDLRVKLTPYLTYNLKFVSANKKPRQTFFNLGSGLTTETNKSTFGSIQYQGISKYKIFNKQFLPILIPISDLTIEQTIEFYDFGSLDLEIIDINQWHLELIEEIKTNQKFQLSQFNKLFKWHIDVYGLIPVGLAISIHDVEQVIA